MNASLNRIAVMLAVSSLIAATARAEPSEDKTRTRNVAIVLYEGVELLDFAGPGEVFDAASKQATAGGENWFNVYTVAATKEMLTSQGFVRIQPEFDINDAPDPDIIVIPGGNARNLTTNAAFLDWIKRQARKNELTMSVCNGALALAATDLLDGRKVTTHWVAIRRLRSVAPEAEVLENTRFVDSGNIVTTAGVSAGIDGALHVTARLLGLEAARATAKYMEYEWRPKDERVKDYSRWNPQLDDRGRAVQRADYERGRNNWSAAAEAYKAIVESDPSDHRSWYWLGLALHSAGRLDEAIPAHEKAGSFPDSPYRDNAIYNLACAYSLKNQPDKALDALSRAVDAGMTDRSWAEQDSDLDNIRALPRFKKILDRMQ